MKYKDFFNIDIETLSMIGVYSIHHDDSPDIKYIGSTSKVKKGNKLTDYGFYNRFYTHLWLLRSNKHYFNKQNLITCKKHH